jgi:trimethylamine--corrinoid protein Co-methyltransferase
MPVENRPIEPIIPHFKVRYLTDDQLNQIQEATLAILEDVGVRFPSDKAQRIFSDHNAHVDSETQVVKIPRDLVFKAMETVPRYFKLGARDSSFDLQLQDGVTYFATDGCGVETVDLETGERRPSRKADVGLMARVSDYLSSIAFYWPMVSAQDFGLTGPLHELDASWNNTGKHVQSETLMGEATARYAIELGTVVAGSMQQLTSRPPLSALICTIAPLAQDKEGIEGALLFAEAGIPVGFMAMPTMGTTAPTTLAGAMVVGDAEVISATVLMQLASPGAPVFYSLIPAWADPRSGAYVAYSLNSPCRFGQIELAHHWGMSALGGAFGTESVDPGTWQAATDVALDPLLVAIAGAEIVTGIGMNDSFTLLHPEAIIMDDELYHRARYALMSIEVNSDTLALDAIQDVGPGGHFLAHKHTRERMRTLIDIGLTHQLDSEGQFRDPLEVARQKLSWILENHHPEPLETVQQREIERILAAADREMG